MRSRRADLYARIKTVEREFIIARAAAATFTAAMSRGDATLPAGVTRRDVLNMTDHLEGTDLIRLFAAFESGLRTYWAALRDTTPLARDLIAAVAARRTMPDDTRDAVQEVREARNRLVHDDGESLTIPLHTARARFQKFISYLPDGW